MAPKKASTAVPSKRKAAAKSALPKPAGVTKKSGTAGAKAKAAAKKPVAKKAAAQKDPAKGRSMKKAVAPAEEPPAKKVEKPEGATKKAPAARAKAKAPAKKADAQNAAAMKEPAKGKSKKRAAEATEEPPVKRAKKSEARRKEPTKESLPPIPPFATKVKHLAAGGMHSVAVSMEGDVYTTGVNDEGALGRKTDTKIWQTKIEKAEGEDGEGEPEYRPFPDGEFGPEGRLVDHWTWAPVDIPDTFGKVEKVSAGDSHTVALTSLGSLYAWGLFRGESGPWSFLPGQKIARLPTLVYEPKTAQEQVIDICSGSDHVLALTRGGKVLSWGYGAQGQLGRIPTRQMRRREADMLVFGPLSFRGIRGVGTGFKPASIATGSFSSFITSTKGQVVVCGVNNYGQLGLPVEGQNVESNSIHWPQLMESVGGQTVQAVSSGSTHTLVLDTAGRVSSFGKQTYGRLGRKDADCNSDAPLGPGPVDNLEDTTVTGVVAGPDTSCILAEEGQVLMAGMGATYQLARTSDDDAPLPFKVDLVRCKGEPPVTSVRQVDFGGQHTMLLVD